MSAKVNHGLWTAQEQETPCWAELLSQDQWNLFTEHIICGSYPTGCL
jgi:hypothetical protein